MGIWFTNPLHGDFSFSRYIDTTWMGTGDRFSLQFSGPRFKIVKEAVTRSSLITILPSPLLSNVINRASATKRSFFATPFYSTTQENNVFCNQFIFVLSILLFPANAKM